MRAIRHSRRFGTLISLLAALAAGVSGLTACSSIPPVRTGHRGLLDRLSDMDRKYASRHELKHPRPVEVEDEAPSAAAVQVDPRAKELGFRWPLDRVMVTSAFGQRGKEFHEGVDLRAQTGTPVYAAQAGVVLYADRKIRGYGKMVVIRHAFGGVATIYAHNSRLLVHAGQKVKRGQKIAISGSTGHVTGPHLHFEIREGTEAINPLKLMPHLPGVAFKDSAYDRAQVLLSSS